MKILLGREEWKSIRYYVAFLLLLLGVFVYAGMTGWRVYNPDEVTEKQSPGNHSGHSRYYHK